MKYNTLKPVTQEYVTVKPELIDDFINRLQTLLPPGAGAIGEDLKSHIRLKFKELLSSQGLVTQEDFEIQRQVLIRTREKLEALEGRIKELEEKVQL